MTFAELEGIISLWGPGGRLYSPTELGKGPPDLVLACHRPYMGPMGGKNASRAHWTLLQSPYVLRDDSRTTNIPQELV